VIAGADELFKDGFTGMSEGMVGGEIPAGDQGKKSGATATMLENGNIKVVHRTTGTSGLTASVVVEYKPQDEEYREILDQVGGLKVGETKSVPPLR
jgi:hypothetical protein